MELRTSCMYDIYIKGRVGEIEQSKQNKTKPKQKKNRQIFRGRQRPENNICRKWS